MEGAGGGGREEGLALKHTLEAILRSKGVRALSQQGGGEDVSCPPPPGGGRLLFAMIAGSVAFNLALPSSDRDYFAVYAADIERVLGVTRPTPTVDSHEPDLQMYEASRYCELLLKGNPKVIEPLFAEHFTWQAEEWVELKKRRHHLMTQVTVDQYVSYALSQVKDYLKGRGQAPPAKKFYHALRLMQEARRIVVDGAPRVWYDNGDEERENLLAIRKGEKDVASLINQLHQLREEIDEIKTRLPEKTDPDVLSEWLVYLRCKHLSEVKYTGGVRSTSLIDVSDSVDILLHNQALDLLCRFGVNGRVLCCIPSGSRAHGLPGSTVDDYIAIYVAPTERVVGLSPPPQKVDNLGPNSKQRETYTRGMIIFEVGYACQLLLQGNHRLLEALFFDNEAKLPSFETPKWRELKEQASCFITQPALNNYLGIAQSQLQIQPLTRTNLYHALRLLIEAQHLLDHHRPCVYLPPEKRAFLSRVRDSTAQDDVPGAEYSVDNLLATAKAQLTALMTEGRDKLPRSAEKAPLDAWLFSVRSSLLESAWEPQVVEG